MPSKEEISNWTEILGDRYHNYLRTLFYFKDPTLRESFNAALQGESEGDRKLIKGPFPESGYSFQQGVDTKSLAEEYFNADSDNLLPALEVEKLYTHQEQAIRKVYAEKRNVVVATGTASGKTESFLYPILFDLYQQHLNGQLSEPGVRALILYPMNALANDQRRRLGDICRYLDEQKSSFNFKFGQYIGATVEKKSGKSDNYESKRLPGELIYREEMREEPPHILLTNYSMLEYLLIRPKDSELFDNDRGKHWQFIVLDEAHQYRGTKGMEMGMLVRRLKQRVRTGGRKGSFRCIATSATIASGEGEEDKNAVAQFAENLFDEEFSANDIIFGTQDSPTGGDKSLKPQRFHLFISALEGAFFTA